MNWGSKLGTVRFVVFVLVSSSAACGSDHANDAGGGGAGRNAGKDGGVASSGGACVVDDDCTRVLPTSDPPGCAQAKCDVLQNTCIYSTRDADGDGHLAAVCKIAGATFQLQVGDDCDDGDATIFPGAKDVCDGKVHTCGATQCACAEGTIQVCYTGALSTRSVGVCKDGTRECVNGAWADCKDQVLPNTVDLCDGRDENCDGIENTPSAPSNCACVNGATQPCYTGASATRNVGICKDGTQECVSGAWTECRNQVLPNAADLCDGGDENCDGINNTPTPPSSCTCINGATSTCNLGRCNESTVTCASGAFPSCAAPIAAGSWCYDGDNDGFCAAGDTTVTSCENPNRCPAEFPGCTAPKAWKPATTPQNDCDDTSSTIVPDVSWCYDGDHDGYCAVGWATVKNCGNPNKCPVEYPGCPAPTAWKPATTTPQTDCDDKVATTNPEMAWCYDGDSDGVCASGEQLVTHCGSPTKCPVEDPGCAAPGNWRLATSTVLQTDCNDKDASAKVVMTWCYDGDGDHNCASGWKTVDYCGNPNRCPAENPSCTAPANWRTGGGGTDCNDSDKDAQTVYSWCYDGDRDLQCALGWNWENHCGNPNHCPVENPSCQDPRYWLSWSVGSQPRPMVDCNDGDGNVYNRVDGCY